MFWILVEHESCAINRDQSTTNVVAEVQLLHLDYELLFHNLYDNHNYNQSSNQLDSNPAKQNDCCWVYGNNRHRVWCCELDHRTSLSFSVGADEHQRRRSFPLSVVPFGFVSLFFDCDQFVLRLPPLAGGPTFIEAGVSFIILAHTHSFHSKLSRIFLRITRICVFPPSTDIIPHPTYFLYFGVVSFILLHQPQHCFCI